MNKHIYENDFFTYVNTTSMRSAEYFLKVIKFPFPIESVIDIGCGQGAWLNQWQKYTQDIYGIDGGYVNINNLLIEHDNFKAADLTQYIDLGRKFSLVQCLEVAEHIDITFADILVDNIIRHGDIILFSAAQPGQGGEFHVNEQPISYWVDKFSQRGYICFDYIRPQIKDIIDIEPWYRFNTIIFIQKDKLPSLQLDNNFMATKVYSNYNFTTIISKKWLLRNRLLSYLPVNIITRLSKVKQHLLPLIKRT
ncbi:methyltransferase domain-containing protein [Aggregatibacter actinomycetemcomitans]|uniref:methyltransferase domain-containing protein n=1 Tax=Aggregatibacter actinomycetemcomitans TaxID=714 RepID=UPI00197C512E|nr:methyltransferase domain-containing protein [Aggregatibacter actinomycetemcomitans]MBN6070627.1 methyltransferase domain-containing protein [Aggregatibacter actinomycetemcomitans]